MPAVEEANVITPVDALILNPAGEAVNTPEVPVIIGEVVPPLVQ